MTTRPLLEVAGSHVSKVLTLNVSRTKSDVALKERYDRFSFVGDHIHASPIFKYAWTTLGHALTEGF